MAVQQEFHFPSADGTVSLYGRRWLPEQDSPVAVLQIVHGISEHIGRYDHFASFMANHGFIVVAEDHLGHGYTAATPEDLGYTAPRDGWRSMTDNIHQLYLLTREQYPHLPYLLLGHSMGSFLSRSFLIRYPGCVDACALLGTGQQSPAVLTAGLSAIRLERLRMGDHGRSKLLQNLCFGSYNSKFKPNRTPSDWICSVDAVVDAYVADPFCQRMPTVALMGDMLTGIRFNQQRENLAQMDLDTPVLFLSGGQDPVGNFGKGVEQAYRSFINAGCRSVSLRMYPDGRHEMLNECNKNEVYLFLLQWMRRQINLTQTKRSRYAETGTAVSETTV